MASGQQPAPTPGAGKSAAVILSTSISTIFVWYLKYAKGLDVPAEVAIAASGILTTLIVWFVPHSILTRGS